MSTFIAASSSTSFRASSGDLGASTGPATKSLARSSAGVRWTVARAGSAQPTRSGGTRRGLRQKARESEIDSWQQYRPMRRLPTIPVILAGFAAFLDLYMTQPLLPLLARTFKASTFHVGLTITAPTVAVAITAPFIGRLADRLGLRRVIVGSACALTVATVLAAT